MCEIGTLPIVVNMSSTKPKSLVPFFEGEVLVFPEVPTNIKGKKHSIETERLETRSHLHILGGVKLEPFPYL